jgi:hypothetical protein
MRLGHLRLLLGKRRYPPDRAGNGKHRNNNQRRSYQLAGIRSRWRLDDACQVRLPDLGEVGINLDELVGRFTDEVGVVADVATCVHGRTERLVVLRLEGIDDLGVGVNALGHLQHGQPEFFATGPQSRADTASFHCHGNQPEL